MIRLKIMYLQVHNFYIDFFWFVYFETNIFLSVSFRIYIVPLRRHTTGPALNVWEIPVLADLS